MTARPGPVSRGTAWTRNLEAPLRQFLRTETGSAAVLLVAVIAALAWVNIDAGSYQRVWGTTLSIRVGHAGLSQDLRHWIDNGLMAFFFDPLAERAGPRGRAATAFGHTFWRALGATLIALIPASVLAITQRRECQATAPRDAHAAVA